MRTAALSISTFAIALIAFSSAQAEITWQDNLRTAHSKAQTEGKHLLLHFYSDNCTWCERLEKGSFQNPVVASTIDQGYVAVKIHANTSPKLAQMFKVSKFPTDVIVDVQGKTLSHSVSPQDPNLYVAMLTKSMPSATSAAPQQDAIVEATPKAAPATPGGAPNYATMAAPQSAPTAAKTQVAASPAPPTEVPSATASFTLPTDRKVNAGLTSTSLNDGLALEMPSQLTEPANAASNTVANAAAAAQAKIDAVSLGFPPEQAKAKVSAPAPAAAAPVATSEDTELAMQGFCAVTVINEDRWVEGSPEFGVIHLGKLYLFTNQANMEKFLADPVPFTPVLNEIDVVRFFEEKKIVPGKREWGLKDPIHNRMFFFADEAAMNHFYNEYERYTDAAIEVMTKAVKAANPGA